MKFKIEMVADIDDQDLSTDMAEFCDKLEYIQNNFA